MSEPTNTEHEGAAIDGEELDRLAEQYDETAPETAGELMESDSPTTAEAIRPIVDLACAVAAPNWNIQEGEREALAGAYGDLIDKYFPEGVGAWGVELNALLVTAAIFGPRVRKGVPAREAPKEAESQEQSGKGKAADEN